MKEHRRAGWYAIGGALSSLGALWLVGWAVAVGQSSAPHKLHYLVFVTYAAAVLFVAGLILIVAVMYDWPVWLASRLPGLPRLPLKLSITDREWESYKYIALIGAFRVRIQNTTGKRIRLSGIGFQTDNRGLPSWRGTASEADVLDVDRELHRRRETSHYGVALRNFSDVPARETISGWVVEAMTRDSAGGTPACTITIRDQLGNQYEAKVNRVEPRKP